MIGSVLIVGGLYSVLWGKNKEMNEIEEEGIEETVTYNERDAKNDGELQSYTASNDNHHVVVNVA